MDVFTAFLNPELNEELFIDLPQCGNSCGKVCKLIKAVYGLQQASRKWNQNLNKILHDLGLVQSRYDPCIY